MINPERVPPDRYPWWVKLARMGARSKASQFVWFGIEFALTVVLLLFAALDTGTQRLIDIGFSVWSGSIAVMSLATVYWMDRHGTWG